MLFMTGSIVSHVAGFLNFFRTVSLYMILDDHPIIRLIFLKRIKCNSKFYNWFHLF